MPKESVLTAAEKTGIRIRKFIFHIIIANEDMPFFLDEVVLNDPQREFFRDRVIDASYGTQFVFNDRETSPLFNDCRQILSDPDRNFIPISRKIAQDFTTHHRGNMSDGAFVVALVDMRVDTLSVPLVSLIKMDNTKVLQYRYNETTEGRRAFMEEITNSFVEDKNAMQKVALVELGNHFAWDVLARDRKCLTGGIAEYFRGFLHVKEREDASVLTRRTVSAVQQWAIRQEEDLPEGQDWSSYKTRAYTYMQTHDTFETGSFLDMVLMDEDAVRKERHRRTLEDFLAVQGIAGQTFAPKPASLRRSERKNRVETSEGVKIEWDGEARTRGVEITQTQDGGKEIRIRTHRLNVLS